MGEIRGQGQNGLLVTHWQCPSRSSVCVLDSQGYLIHPGSVWENQNSTPCGQDSLTQIEMGSWKILGTSSLCHSPQTLLYLGVDFGALS